MLGPKCKSKCVFFYYIFNQVRQPSLRGPVSHFSHWAPWFTDCALQLDPWVTHKGTTVWPRTSLGGPFDRACAIWHTWFPGVVRSPFKKRRGSVIVTFASVERSDRLFGLRNMTRFRL